MEHVREDTGTPNTSGRMWAVAGDLAGILLMHQSYVYMHVVMYLCVFVFEFARGCFRLINSLLCTLVIVNAGM